jgi:hypothetical protein
MVSNGLGGGDVGVAFGFLLNEASPLIHIFLEAENVNMFHLLGDFLLRNAFNLHMRSIPHFLS